MAESMVLICPTRQARRCAADWRDGQLTHGGCAGGARRASEYLSIVRRSQTKHRPDANAVLRLQCTQPHTNAPIESTGNVIKRARSYLSGALDCALSISVNLVEAILRPIEGPLTRAGLYNWLTTPGVALVEDLPHPN
jgi:hypothetical protein